MVVVTESDKHYSFSQHGIDYTCEGFIVQAPNPDILTEIQNNQDGLP